MLVIIGGVIVVGVVVLVVTVMYICISNDSNNSSRSNSSRSDSTCSNNNREAKIEVIGEYEEVTKNRLLLSLKRVYSVKTDNP